MRRLVLPATIALLTAFSAKAQEGSSFLDRVAKNYREMQSIEIAGTLSSPLPESDLTIHVQSDFAVARPPVVPVKHGPVRPFETRRFGSVTFTDAKGLAQRAPENLGPIGVPGNFGGHEKLNQDVGKVTELPRETLNLAEGPVSCRVLQVEYDQPDWPPEERHARYWIDEMRLLVLKEEFSQSQRHEHKTSLWHWVYEAKSVNQPPPDWLVEFAKRSATQRDGRQLTDRIGKNAPEFTLADLDSNSLSLSAMMAVQRKFPRRRHPSVYSRLLL